MNTLLNYVGKSCLISRHPNRGNTRRTMWPNAIRIPKSRANLTLLTSACKWTRNFGNSIYCPMRITHKSKLYFVSNYGSLHPKRSEEFNKHNPPKKIDMFQMSILEFVNRPGSPLFHLEHYIEGNYIKYNSNAGFVEDLHLRLTPHAFSHFTFECSNHELIIVDIQGVGDLYTGILRSLTFIW